MTYAEVIGDPIAHSKSPAIHNFWLGKLGIEAEYRLCHVRADELADYFARRRADPLWRGCNVTLPHKVATLGLIERTDDVAAAVGAANCVVHGAPGVLTATNTDCDGFNEPIADLALEGREIAVLGAGGAARAALMLLVARRTGFVTVHARDPGLAKDLLIRLGLTGAAIPFDAPLAPATALLVNCSPLGMTGMLPLEIDLAPLPFDATVYDVVYDPLETPLLAAARAKGLRAVDGLAMLIGQATVAFELFFDVPAPRQHDAELRGLLTS
ncbi:MAG TPA: shikimate dehydrogenase [Novosphingobium sp.]|nr:shikimate dehydrogenase [Novosphingobium sp.]